MDTRFTVNLNTRRVIDKVTKSRVPVPQEVLPSLDEIEKYVRKTITNQKEAAERAVIARSERKRKAEEERAAQVHDFYGRLEEHGLWVPPQDSENDDYEDFQDTQCILCSSTLVNCLTCHRLCCCHSPVDDDPERTESDSEDSLEVPDTDEDDTKGCRAWCMDKLRTCVGHGQRSFCESCRGGKEGEAEKLLACPSCGTWECAEDFYWCIGRIPPQSAETDGSAGSLTPSSPEGTTGRHPPKHACSQCVKDGSADWMVCACIRCWSLQNAPLKGIVYKYVCRECSPKGGQLCSGNHQWVCDVCVLRPGESPVLQCPRCKEYFCEERCGLKICTTCCTIGWCPECMKEWKERKEKGEVSEGDEANEPPDLKATCAGCGAAVCSSCVAKKHLQCCENCYKDACDNCIKVDKCVLCGGDLCQCCGEDKCNCGGIGECNPEYMYVDEAIDSMMDYNDDYYY